MHQCPRCRSERVHRSRTTKFWELWRRRLTGKRPFRCHVCGWRGWGFDIERPRQASDNDIEDGQDRRDRAISLEDLDRVDDRRA